MVDRAGTGGNEEFEAFEASEAAETSGYADDSYGNNGADGHPGLDSLSMMHHDDALLSALGGTELDRSGDVGEQELNELLLAWRRDIDSEPMGELVDTDTAVAAIGTAAAAERKRHRAHRQKAFVPVAVAAAVLMIAFTGTGLAARSAEPGDPLWGLTQVLYTDHAQSVQAAFSARLDLDTADDALAHGRFRKAADALNAAARAIEHVQPDDQQQELQVQHNQLVEKLPQRAGSTQNPRTQGGSTSAPTSTTGGTMTTSPQEPSSSAQPTESKAPSQPTATSQPEVPPSTSSRTPTPSSSAQRTSGDSGDEAGGEGTGGEGTGGPATGGNTSGGGGGVSPKLDTSDEQQTSAPPPPS